MPRRRMLTRVEKLDRRLAIAAKAKSGELRLPDAIKELRNALGLTQAEFGERFGLTRLQVISIEKGIANSTRETLEKIGKPFGFVLGYVPRPRMDEHEPPDT